MKSINFVEISKQVTCKHALTLVGSFFKNLSHELFFQQWEKYLYLPDLFCFVCLFVLYSKLMYALKVWCLCSTYFFFFKLGSILIKGFSN